VYAQIYVHMHACLSWFV